MRHTLVALAAFTLYLALSGFDCASTEMTTAKVALQQKDYKKAEDNLKKEVAARPQNGQAWVMLGELYEQQKRYDAMNDAYTKALAATTPALTEAEKTNLHAKRYNAWLESYNNALNLYNDASGKRETYQQALEQLDAAAGLRPDHPENLFLRAMVYREMEDKANETKAYRDYIALVRPEVEAGMKAGLALGMSPAQVQAKLGAPTKMVAPTDSTGGYAHYAADDLYIFFTPSKGGEAKIEGWKYYKSSSVPDVIKRAPITLRSAPYYTLGVDAYYEGEKNSARYNEALEYLQQVQRFDMQQDRVGQIIADIYSRTNRSAEAKTSFEENIRQNPNDPSLYINYGTLLVNLKDYPNAIENFRKVLSISKETDDKHQTALFNLGAVYKNWGAIIQDSLRTKHGDRLNAKQVDLYAGKLKESVDYFERYRKINSSDFGALAELANLYIVLGESAKLRDVIAGLQSMEGANATNADYWMTMSKVYVVTGENDKSEAAMKKADSLR